MMSRKFWAVVLLIASILGLVVTGCGPKAPQVTTLAGSTRGYADGSGTEAQFDGPVDVAVDPEGNVYVADSANHRARVISPKGEVTTLAGSDDVGYADGSVAEALFSTPTGIALDESGNVYVADSAEMDPHPLHVRIVTPDGTVTTLAGSGQSGFRDGVGIDAQFKVPAKVVVDTEGNVYVADINNHRIRLVRSDGTVSTLAGDPKPGYAAGYADGLAAEAKFNSPRSVAVDAKGNVYVADSGNHCIRVISPDGQVSTLAGAKEPGYVDGQGSEARFNFPAGIATDADGNLYVADTANHSIRQVTPEGLVTTLAGNGESGSTDGLGAEAQLRSPEGIAVDSGGNVYVADTGNHRIRKITQP
jgi:sugar lactone lactonase YvrE